MLQHNQICSKLLTWKYFFYHDVLFTKLFINSKKERSVTYLYFVKNNPLLTVSNIVFNLTCYKRFFFWENTYSLSWTGRYAVLKIYQCICRYKKFNLKSSYLVSELSPTTKRVVKNMNMWNACSISVVGSYFVIGLFLSHVKHLTC